MHLYDFVLFLHLLTVGGAFFMIGIMIHALLKLRTAPDLAAARAAGSAAAALGKRMPLITVALLLTGAYLTQTRWSWGTSWIDVSIAGLLLVTVFGGAVIGGRERALGKALGRAANGEPEEALERSMRDPLLVAGSAMNAGIVCGVMFVMTMKPGAIAGVAALIAFAILGVLAGLGAIRQGLPAASSARRAPAA